MSMSIETWPTMKGPDLRAVPTCIREPPIAAAPCNEMTRESNIGVGTRTEDLSHASTAL